MDMGNATAAMPAGHDHAAHDMGLECDGSHVSSKKGSWKGHVLPGCAFIIWGSWWAYNVIVYWLWRSARRPYRGRSWYPMGVRALWYIEPVLKVLVPAVAVSMELYIDHAPMAYRYLICPEGSMYAGRFALSHMNNWQHAASYPLVVLSGLVDIVARFIHLPERTCQAVLGLGLGVMAFLMGTHEKHEPQDKMVHWLLFLCMALCAALVFLEMALRRSMLAGLAKALALVFQGAWLCQIAAIEFEDRRQWSTEYGGGAMFAPVMFSFIFVMVVASGLALYVVLALLARHRLLPRSPLLPPAEAEEMSEGDGEEQERGPLLPTHTSARHHRYDSAAASDDNDSQEGDGLLQHPPLKGGRSKALDGAVIQLAAKADTYA